VSEEHQSGEYCLLGRAFAGCGHGNRVVVRPRHYHGGLVRVVGRMGESEKVSDAVTIIRLTVIRVK